MGSKQTFSKISSFLSILWYFLCGMRIQLVSNPQIETPATHQGLVRTTSEPRHSMNCVNLTIYTHVCVYIWIGLKAVKQYSRIENESWSRRETAKWTMMDENWVWNSELLECKIWGNDVWMKNASRLRQRILCQISKRTVQMEIGVKVQTSPFAWCERVDFWQYHFLPPFLLINSSMP